jgi:hypothetical protein
MVEAISRVSDSKLERELVPEQISLLEVFIQMAT